MGKKVVWVLLLCVTCQGLLMPALAVGANWGEAGTHSLSFSDDQNNSSTFKFYSPDNGGTAKGLIVYLHGDTAAEYESIWPSVQAEAQRRGLRAVSVRSVNCQGEYRWWYCVDQNSNYLRAVLGEIDKTYGLDKSSVVFSGQSGGATFLGSWFLPKYGNAYGGGALLACPGLLTELHKPGVFAGAPATDRFKVRVLTSERDKLKAIYGPGAQNMSKLWARAGFKTEFDESPGRQHCDFDKPFAQHLGEVTAQFLGAEQPARRPPANASSGSSRPAQFTHGPEYLPRNSPQWLVSTAAAPEPPLEAEGEVPHVQPESSPQATTGTVHGSVTNVSPAEAALTRPVLFPRLANWRERRVFRRSRR